MSETVLTTVFHAWHCDHFGHVNTRAYAAAFDDAICAFWARQGAALAGVVPVTAQMLTTFAREAHAGQVVEVLAELTRVGTKSVQFTLHLQSLAGETLASCAVVEVFFNTETRESAPMPEAIRSKLTSLIEPS